MSHYPETGYWYWYWSSSLHYDRDQLVHVVNEGTKQGKLLRAVDS